MAEPATFLALPGELRNRIYCLYASTYPLKAAHLVHGETVFICAPPLAQVSRQIRHEVLSLESEFEHDLLQVVKLTVTVTDFEFTEFASFFRKPEESHPLPGLENVRLELVFTQACMPMRIEERTRILWSLAYWACAMRVRSLGKLSMEVLAIFQPPELEFEQSGLSSLLEPLASRQQAWTVVVDPKAVAFALRSAIRHRDGRYSGQAAEGREDEGQP